MTEAQIKSLSPELEAAVRKQVSKVKVSREQYLSLSTHIKTERLKRKMARNLANDIDRPQKIIRTWEAMSRDQYEDGDIELIDLTAIEDEEPVPDWLTLPDLAFNEIMMKIALVREAFKKNKTKKVKFF